MRRPAENDGSCGVTLDMPLRRQTTIEAVRQHTKRKQRSTTTPWQLKQQLSTTAR